MVGEAQVEAAPVDVQRGSQEGARHGGALDVPTRTALATRRHTGRLPDPCPHVPHVHNPPGLPPSLVPRSQPTKPEPYRSRGEVPHPGTAGGPLCSAPTGFAEAEAVPRPVSFPELPSLQPGADANPRPSSGPQDCCHRDWGGWGGVSSWERVTLGATVRRDEGHPRRASNPKPQPWLGRWRPWREAPAQRPVRPSGIGPRDGAVLRRSGEALCP